MVLIWPSESNTEWAPASIRYVIDEMACNGSWGRFFRRREWSDGQSTRAMVVRNDHIFPDYGVHEVSNTIEIPNILRVVLAILNNRGLAGWCRFKIAAYQGPYGITKDKP